VISHHHASIKNLDPNREFEAGQVFTKSRSAVRGLLGCLMWGIATYILAWFTLKKRERI
jgi:hypothetical protein